MLVIDSVGLEVPGGEVDTVGLCQKLDGELRHSVFRVQGLLLTLFFGSILSFLENSWFRKRTVAVLAASVDEQRDAENCCCRVNQSQKTVLEGGLSVFLY